MSGHSKWHKIKHQKEATDKKKGQMFGRLAREIVIAAKHEKDPAKNANLREAISRAKKVNMPQSNIDRLLSGSGKPITSALYEGFGPSGIALLILTETDSANRTVNELRSILKEHSGRLGEPGTAAWQFSPHTLIEATTDTPAKLQNPTFEEIELALIDSGAQDITPDATTVIVTGAPESQTNLEDTLRRFEFIITDSKIAYLPNEPIEVSTEDETAIKTLLGKIREHSDVVDVFTNLLVNID